MPYRELANMKPNEGKIDRYIRMGIGILSVILAIILYFTLNSPTNLTLLIILLLIVGAIAIVTSITGFCGRYAVLGISTIKKEE